MITKSNMIQDNNIDKVFFFFNETWSNTLTHS